MAEKITADFSVSTGKVRKELYGSGLHIFTAHRHIHDNTEVFKTLRFPIVRNHDWALNNPNQRMIDVHHIFPRKYLRTEIDAPQRLYNQIANYTFLEKRINIAIGAKRPGEYFTTALDACQQGGEYYGDIKNEQELMDNLDANCIPADVFSMDATDYQRFLVERRELMAKKIKAYFLSL